MFRRSLLRSVFRKHSASQLRCYSVPASSARVLFGSQSGNAQMFAEELGDALRDKVPATETINLNDFDAESFFGKNKKNDMTVFVVSCYGEGEPTDTAKPFFEWLSKQPAQTEGDPLRFTIFGLGNSKTYNNTYQAVGKGLEKRLKELGCVPVFERGEGDDSGTLDRDFSAWKDKFIQEIELCEGEGASSGVEKAAAVKEAASVEQPFRLALLSPMNATLQGIKQRPSVRAAPNLEKIIDSTNPLLLNIDSFKNLCPLADASRGKYEIELNIRNTPVRYTTGDHVGVFSRNDPSLVERFANRMGLPDLSTFVLIESTSAGRPVPFVSTAQQGAVSLRQLLTEFYDLNSLVLPSTLKLFAECATDPQDQALLKELGTSGSSVYVEKIKKPMLNVVDVLETFRSIQLPWQQLVFESLPRIQPRYYSISSSSMVNPDKIRITMGVLQTSRPDAFCDAKIFKGLCSNYLASKTQDEQLTCFVRPSSFRLPEDPSIPLILVGGGTGCAPFRAFIEERQHLLDEKNARLGPALLFFGVPNEKEYMYRNLIEQNHRNGVLSEVHTVFSGVPGGRFVSQELLEHGEHVVKLLNQGAQLFVCGAARGFGDSIFDALHKILIKYEGLSEAEAVNRVQQMRVNHVIQEDLA